MKKSLILLKCLGYVKNSALYFIGEICKTQDIRVYEENKEEILLKVSKIMGGLEVEVIDYSLQYFDNYHYKKRLRNYENACKKYGKEEVDKRIKQLQDNFYKAPLDTINEACNYYYVYHFIRKNSPEKTESLVERKYNISGALVRMKTQEYLQEKFNNKENSNPEDFLKKDTEKANIIKEANEIISIEDFNNESK